MSTLADDVAVVGDWVDDLVSDPPDGDVDPVPDRDPEALELALLEADVGVDGCELALHLGEGLRVLDPRHLQLAQVYGDLAAPPQLQGVHRVVLLRLVHDPD